MKRRKQIPPRSYHPPRGDIRNVERGKRELADMIRDSEKRDQEGRKDEDEKNRNSASGEGSLSRLGLS